MKNTASYSHLFFDLDHTLWDFDKNAEVSLSEIFIEFSLSSVISAEFSDFYQKYLHHNKILWERYHHGYISADDLKWKRMWRTLMDFKIADEKLSKKLAERFLEILPTKKEIFPHTKEILTYLNNKNYKLHLITNGFKKTQWMKVKNSGLDPIFINMITSECSNSLKPKKEIFEYALNKAGANVFESIMLGDNPDADIKGACNAGMHSVYVNHIKGNNLDYATYNISHLSELEHLF